MFIGGNMGEVLTGWILSIVGIVLLGVLIDLILPNGEIQKYIKSIFSIFIVFLMITPILQVDIKKIDFDKFIYNQTSVEVDENFIENYYLKYKQGIENVCENALKNGGFSGVDVAISLNMSSKEFCVEKVELNLKNLEINTNVQHIDKYEEMKDIILSLIEIDREKVVMNE